ncbi:hypothetical protein [Amycolatopsis kentuckyensis]|uniref:hypothetical protein n=1 Tax=Amycolatopsis kentuckyensis TaxID=218823 RepID=UPI000A374827|nr:hypothetical protein [Amycolatopsis kentuckyensis]
MAFSFEDLPPESKRAAFAHMDAKRLGKGARHKKLSAKQKGAVEHQGRGKVSGKLGSGSVKGQLSPADRDKGSMGGKLPIAKARPAAAAPKAPAEPDTPEGRFDKHFTDFMHTFTANQSHGYVGMVDVRKELDARGMPRAEQDTHLKRMSREGKLHIVPEDNRKAMTQADHDAAIRIGGEPNDLVFLADDDATDRAKLKAAAKPEDRYTGPANLSSGLPDKDYGAMASDRLQHHGPDGVKARIAELEAKKRPLPGQRAELAALKSLDTSRAETASPEEISKRPLSQAYLSSGKPTDEDQTVLANRYLLMHGDAGVSKKILQLEGRKRLSPGDRATLAALRALKRK